MAYLTNNQIIKGTVTSNLYGTSSNRISTSLPISVGSTTTTMGYHLTVGSDAELLSREERINFITNYLGSKQIDSDTLKLLLLYFDSIVLHSIPLLNIVEENPNSLKQLIKLNIISDLTLEFILTFSSNKEKLKLILLGNEKDDDE